MPEIKAPGKWIKEIGADWPLADAARQVLSVRVEGLELLLPLAAERADEDDEYVHQLRVATRRSGAALDVFEPCLSPKRYRKTKRCLKRVRRAANDARECDVHRRLLEADRAAAEPAVSDVLGRVMSQLDEERRTAQLAIGKAAERYPVQRLRRSREKLVDAAREPDSRLRLIDRAGELIPAMLVGVRAAATSDLTALDSVHELRLTCKRLRYAIEVLRACFSAGFDALYGSLGRLQEQLGDINDSHELRRRVEAWAAANTTGEAADARPAIGFYEQRLAQQARAFVASWEGGGRDDFFRTLDQFRLHVPRS